MLTPNEHDFVYRLAYLPEHIPSYVETVSRATPCLLDNYLCYSRTKHLLFIGYPLGIPTGDTALVFQSAREKFNPATIAIIAPDLWYEEKPIDWEPEDYYYKLDLPVEKPSPDQSYMIRRARKELSVTEGKFGKDHKNLIKNFIATHDFSKDQKYLFKKIPEYLKKSSTARMIEARRGDELAAFSIVDLGAADFAFYLFSFRSVHLNIPGASDLLFWQMVQMAQFHKKKAINLGLGINPGIRRFKEKWDGKPFLTYTSNFISNRPFDLGGLAKKL